MIRLMSCRRIAIGIASNKIQSNKRYAPLLHTLAKQQRQSNQHHEESSSFGLIDRNTAGLIMFSLGCSLVATTETWKKYEQQIPFHQQTLCDASTVTTRPTGEHGPVDLRKRGSSAGQGDNEFQIKQVYDIEEVLGEGAYGMVYRARRKSDGMMVALKTMPREYTGKTDFEREVAALQWLSQQQNNVDEKQHESASTHVVKLFDLHRDNKNYYLAMELVDGGELFEHLIQNGPYSEALAAQFMRQFAEALCLVHASGYCHADLKPENLMLATSSASASSPHDDSALTLKVVDFGCASPHDEGRKDMLLPADEFAVGCSFLHQVALGNQFELQRMLQERPELGKFRDYDKRTALHIAASEGHLDICRFLVERGAGINRVDRWGGSPMDDAHRQGHVDVLEFLGQNGGKFGNTARTIEKFISAASQGDVEEVKALLEFGNIDLNQGDYDQRTALHLAAGEGRATIVKLLCEAGADVNVKDRWGNLPIDDAKRSSKNSDAVVKILKEYGAQPGFAARLSAKLSRHAKQNLPFLVQENSSEGLSGTIAYWSPEMFSKGAKPTPAADMWAAGVIVYVLLTGTHPFDKNADATDEQMSDMLKRVGATLKAKDGEERVDWLEKLVFDERVEGLSNSCIDLMRKLMHPNPSKRMTSEAFRRHPWVQGLTASWSNLAKGFNNLEVTFWQNRFRDEILKKFSISHGIGDGETLSEQELATIFSSLDLKQNGVIELEEMYSIFGDLGIPEKNIKQIFECADLDGTGVIRLDEFRALMSPKLVGKDDDSGDGPGLQIRYLQNRFKNHILNRFGKRQLREIFNAIDLEGNGVLDPHEIRVVLRSAGEPEDVISRIVASLDVNHDGGVDWSEFQGIMGVQDDD